MEPVATEMNNQDIRVITTKANNLAAKAVQDKPVTVKEMKALFGLWGTMETLFHKNRYEQYWISKEKFVTGASGFSFVMTRDSFLAIWSV